MMLSLRRGLFSLLLALAPVSLALAPIPAQAQNEQAAPAETAPIAVDGVDAQSDARIARRLRDILQALGRFEDVRIDVRDGVVRLEGTVLDGAAQEELTRLAGRLEGVVAVQNNTEISGDIEERLAPAWDRLAARARTILADTPVFLIAVAIGLAIALLGGWLGNRVMPWSRIAPNAFVAEVYGALTRLAFALLGLVVALEILNATAILGAVLGAAGIVGLAVGFAVRDTVENFIASLMLSLRQPFRPDDLVEIEGDVGRVARLTSRATVLISAEGNHIRIPNATVFKGRIVNYTREPLRRFDFELGVDAEADHSAALATGVDAISALPFVQDDPPVSAWIRDVGDSNVILTFTGWVDQTRTDFLKARGAAIQAAKVALEENGFGLPEPIYRLRLDAAPGLKLDLPRDGRVTTEDAEPEAPARPRRTAPLPSAADPQITEDATREVAERERAEAGEERNLLDHTSETE